MALFEADPQPSPGANDDVVPVVVQQHVEEAAILRNIRSAAVAAPHLRLHQLRRLDDRIAAHLDGLALAHEEGWKFCAAALENPGVGQLFVTAVRALEDRQSRRFEKLLALVEAIPEAERGLTSACGWVSGRYLQGTIKDLLSSGSHLRQRVALTCCALHRVDPGTALVSSTQDGNSMLRSRALRAIGELGRHDLRSLCQRGLADEDSTCRFFSAQSAVLLGDRSKALDVLRDLAFASNSFRDRALGLLLISLRSEDAHSVLQTLATDRTRTRCLVQGSGLSGDAAYIPWLIARMYDDNTARRAGGAFSLIVGLDLSSAHLDRPKPDDFEGGPTGSPEDPNVEMDPDDGLPWPDAEKIERWWAANAARFQPGTRYFMGAPVTRAHCIDVLKNGYQRQRILAAHYLCLLDPGTPLFNTSAPAWRQQRLLAQMA